MADRTSVRLRRLAARYGAQPTPLDVLGNSREHELLFQGYADESGMLRAARAQTRAGFRTEKRGILDTRRMDLASAAGAALERGVLGSSTDYTTREDIRRGADTALAGARTTRNQSLIQNWSQVMQSRRNYEMGALGLQQQEAAQRATANANSLLNDTIQEILNSGRGGGRGGGRPDVGSGRPDREPRPGELRQDIAGEREAIQSAVGIIEKNAAAAGMGRPQALAEIEKAKKIIREAFRDRNRLRVQLGQDPLARARLRQMIQEAMGGGV